MVVALLAVKVVAGLPAPKSTAVAPAKPLPLIVTKLPLAALAGLTEVMAGAGGAV